MQDNAIEETELLQVMLGQPLSSLLTHSIINHDAFELISAVNHKKAGQTSIAAPYGDMENYIREVMDEKRVRAFAILEPLKALRSGKDQ